MLFQPGSGGGVEPMHRSLSLLIVLALTLLVRTAGATADTVERPDLQHHFADVGTTGTMVVERSGGGQPRTWLIGTDRSARRFIPSSTFKIPNALLAIDRGVASGADQRYPGPNPNVFVNGAPFLPATCEGDLTLATALTSSCIPVFQQIARAIGAPAYARALKQLRYGNQDIARGQVDRFWLDGPLTISAREQVEFLRRLERGALPVSRRAVREVEQMLVLERGRCTVLHGKTGYVFTTAPRVGWWVGWVERGASTHTFALNLDITRPEHAAARTAIGRAVLTELGALGGSATC